MREVNLRDEEVYICMGGVTAPRKKNQPGKQVWHEKRNRLLRKSLKEDKRRVIKKEFHPQGGSLVCLNPNSSMWPQVI